MKIFNHSGKDFILAHFQGGCYVGFYPMVLHFGKKPVELPTDISIVTACNNPDRSMLITQLECSGINYLNDAQLGAPWSNLKKIGHVASALARVKTKYVLILDAADVLFVKNPADICQRLDVYGKRLLFGATQNEHPKRLIDKISNRDFRGRFRYLNAGTAFGYTEDAKRFYRLVRDKLENDEIFNPDQSEQLIVRHAFAECTDWVDFDYNCTIFQTFGGTELATLDEQQEIYKVA